jgi:hypothetical protein
VAAQIRDAGWLSKFKWQASIFTYFHMPFWKKNITIYRKLASTLIQAISEDISLHSLLTKFEPSKPILIKSNC